MRIAVVNETSAADRNADIIAALDGRGHDILNAGMRRTGQPPELTFINTGFLSALLLNTSRADLVIGGCGTGQGFQISAAQYPNVFCGRIETPLDALLFARINAGNCISLALNQGYGWGADINVRLVFDQLLSETMGIGYPAHRSESQRQSRSLLAATSETCHRSMAEIVHDLDDSIIVPVLAFPGVWGLLDVETLEDRSLAQALRTRHQRLRAV
jgi:ribose 5-phosphate isomerase RpiB